MRYCSISRTSIANNEYSENFEGLRTSVTEKESSSPQEEERI